MRIRRVRTADDIPICLEVCSIAADAVPGLEDGIVGDSLYDDLRTRFGITAVRADQEIHAVVLDEERPPRCRRRRSPRLPREAHDL